MSAMITQNRAGPIDKRVLLYSGGMDSVCFDYLLKPDICLYIPTGSAYEDREGVCIDALHKKGLMWGQLEELNAAAVDLSLFERDDAIVPNRNAHLVLLASHYGDTIYLSSVEGDRSTDKDYEFYRLMTQLLDHMWSEQHWTAQRKFYISSPFKTVTKTSLVGRYLAQGGSAEALLISYSCYAGAAKHCGVCKPCARKRVALENNNVAIPDDYFAENFWETEWYKTLQPGIRAHTYRGAEDRDFCDFLDRRGIA